MLSQVLFVIYGIILCHVYGLYSIDLDCYEFYECAGDSFNYTYSSIDCYGAFSCFETKFLSNVIVEDLSLGGALGIVDSNTLLGGKIENIDSWSCLGIISSQFIISDDIVEPEIENYGVFGIINSNFTSSSDNLTINLYNYGYAGIINSYFEDIYYLESYGYYGLYNTKIILSKESYVYMYARMASYGSTIYCTKGSTCEIECYTPTSCYGMSLICEEGATCDVYCDEMYGIFCPIEYSNSSLIKYYPLQLDNLLKPTDNINLLWNSLSLIDPSDDESYFTFFNNLCFEMCLNESSCNYEYYTIDTILNYTYNIPDPDTALCLLGGTTFDDEPYVNITGYDIYIFGEECADSGFWIADNIYALGDYSIETCDLIESSNNGIIFCGGAYSCYECDEIRGASVLYCLGDGACYAADIIGIPEIYLFSYEAGSSSAFYTNKPEGMNMTIYIDGDDADSFDVICENGNDTCIVYCFEQEFDYCDDVSFDCHEDAICEIRYFTRYTDAPTNMPTNFPSIIPTQQPTNMPNEFMSTEENNGNSIETTDDIIQVSATIDENAPQADNAVMFGVIRINLFVVIVVISSIIVSLFTV